MNQQEVSHALQKKATLLNSLCSKLQRVIIDVPTSLRIDVKGSGHCRTVAPQGTRREAGLNPGT